MISEVYEMLKLGRVEAEIALLPGPLCQSAALVFRNVAHVLLGVVLIAGGIATLPVWGAFVLLRLRDENTTVEIPLRAADENAPTVAIIVPDWNQGGSTVTYASQIRGFRELGWNVNLVIFSSNILRPGELDQATRSVLSRQRSILPMDEVGTVLVIHRRTQYSRYWQIIKERRRGAGRLERYCSAYAYLRKSRAVLENYLADAAVVVCNRISFILYVPRGKRVFLETHDVMSRTQAFHRAEHHAQDLAHELALLRRADVLGCFTQEDRDVLAPAGVPTVISPFTAIADPSNRPLRVLFFGDLHPQNVRSITEALRHLPRDVLFIAVGRIGEALAEFAHLPNVELRGFVPSLHEVLQEDIDVVVVPDFYGTGISIKMIEACSWGRPVFATAKALRGLPSLAATIPREAIASDDPGQFFAQLQRVAPALKAADWSGVRKCAREAFGAEEAGRWAQLVVDTTTSAGVRN